MSGRVIENETGCWEWQGCRGRGGYGEVRIGGVKFKTHRKALAEKLGRDLAVGEHARHMCHNRACCNPAHLEVGSAQDNSDDKVRAGRQAHSGGRKSSVGDEQVAEVRRRWATGERQVDIAKAMGLTKDEVFRATVGAPRPEVIHNGARPATQNRILWPEMCETLDDSQFGTNAARNRLRGPW